MYESKITFTLDTICPWTYLAKKRLDTVLQDFVSSPESSSVKFTLRFLPYQLYPSFSAEGEAKREWYTRTKYYGDITKNSKYETLMASYGEPLGIKFDFGGTIANTLNAHRVLQWFQQVTGDDDDDFVIGSSGGGEELGKGKYGPEVINKLVNALYRSYFEEQMHPSSKETLLKACLEAGINETEAKRVVEDENIGLVEVKGKLRMSVANAVDSVPHVVIEGRRRDLTLVGAKDVGEYEKALQTILKEST